jgi:hypothetical protein
MDEKQRNIFDALAGTAEAIARTADHGAEVHDSAAQHLPGAAEHADRDRRFAEAERAAAAAYRSGRVPPESVRQTIRDIHAQQNTDRVLPRRAREGHPGHARARQALR